MKNKFLSNINNIGHVLHHKSKPANQDNNIYKEVGHYSKHIKSLAKQLDRAMFSKTELDLILKIVLMYMTWDEKEEKHIESIIRKLKTLSEIANITRWERIK